MKILQFTFVFAIIHICCQSCTIRINDDGSKYLTEESETKVIDFDTDKVGKKTIYNTQEEMLFQEINAFDIKKSVDKNAITWVYLWASWCTPCIEKLPEMIKRDAENKHLNIMFIAEDYKIGALQKLLHSRGYKGYPYLLNANQYGTKSKEKSKNLFTELCSNREFKPGFPQNFIFKNGALEVYESGSLSEDVLVKMGL